MDLTFFPLSESYLSKRNSAPWRESLFFFSFFCLIPCLIIPGFPDPVLPVQITALPLILFFITLTIVRNKNFNDQINVAVRQPAVFVFLLFLIAMAISLFWAINPAEGIYDLIKTSSSLVLLIFSMVLFTNWRPALPLAIRLVLFTSSVFVIVGIVQFFVFANAGSSEEYYHSLYEITGLSGHKNQFAIALFLLLPWLIYGVFSMHGHIKNFAVLITIAVFLLILLLQSRSVWLGLLSAFVCFLFFAFFLKRKKPVHFKQMKKQIRYALASGILLIAVFVIIVLGSKYLTHNNVLHFQATGLIDAGEKRNIPRLSIWASSLEMINDHTIVGVGAGNWKIDIPPYQKDFLETHPALTNENPLQFQTWLRPHNDFIWILAEKGLPGILSYLAFVVLIIVAGLKQMVRSKTHTDSLLMMLMVASLTGYFTLSLFTFPYERVGHQLYIMLMSGLILSRNLPEGSRNQNKKHARRLKQLSLSVFLLITLLGVVYGFFALRSGYYAGKAFSGEQTQRAGEFEAYLTKAFSPVTTLDIFGNPFHYYLGLYAGRTNRAADAEKFLLKAEKYHPKNLEVLKAIASLYLQTQRPAMSRTYLEKVLQIYPFDNETLLRLATLQYFSGETEQAYQTLLRSNPGNKSPVYQKMREEMENTLNSESH
jgi:O-antigen ligase